MEKIKSEDQAEYQKILNELSRDGIAIISDFEFEILPTFPPSQWKAKFVIFKNCLFRSHVYFIYINIKSGIEFEQCTFMRGVSFENCSSNEQAENISGDHPNSVILSRSQLKYRFIISSCKFFHPISICSESVIGNIEMSDNDLHSMCVEQSIIESSVEMTNVKLTDELYFSSVEFKNNVKLDRCQGGNLRILSSKFHAQFDIRDSNFHLFITKDLEFLEEFKLIESNISTLLQLNDCTFKKTFVISNLVQDGNKSCKINSLDLGNCDFQGGLNYEGGAANSIQLNDLQIGCSDRLKGNLNFTNLRIGKVTIGGINVASIVFAYSHLIEFQLLGFINKGALTLVSLCPLPNSESIIYISKSLLGKTFISDCDLGSFTAVTITHSNVTELTTTSVKWFKDKQLNVKNPIDLLFSSPPVAFDGKQAIKAIAFNVKKDLYRQLKFAMERQGDQFNRLRFKKEELTAYRKEINQHPFRQKSIGDQLILWINRSNDYGFNWLKPIGLILLITSVVYCLLAIEINPVLLWGVNLKNSALTFNYLIQNLYNYFNLLNPTHKVTDLFNITTSNQPSFWFYLLDFIDRVIISYLIFQTITAFRKYIS